MIWIIVTFLIFIGAAFLFFIRSSFGGYSMLGREHMEFKKMLFEMEMRGQI